MVCSIFMPDQENVETIYFSQRTLSAHKETDYDNDHHEREEYVHA